jgi:pyruvate/2-oxoglutarate dehydrogenase complex dihydrolipoamide dehydrogenase (E3) component
MDHNTILCSKQREII